MNMTSRRVAWAAASLATVLGMTACGGGAVDASDQASANALDTQRATALARPKPPPPPPGPVTDATLALASASASGQAAEGDACGVSADGGKVLLSSRANNLVADDANGLVDLFLKDFNGNGIARVVTAASNTPIVCLALTPDANTVVFVADAPNGVVNVLGFGGSEPAIMVKNLSTGQQTRVTPLLSAFANVSAYQFAGVSDDGLRVAFIAQPTRTCSGYDCVATGAARMLLRDLSSGALVNLESQVRFTTSQGVADGDAWLSPNGRTMAFSSKAAYPEAGDTTAKSDVYALDIASSTVRLVNTDAAGRQITIAATVSPTYGVQSFLANSSRLAFFIGYDTSAGPAGVYVKDLNSGALDRVLDRNLTYTVGNHAALSFSDDGRKVAYVESTGNTLTGTSVPRVLDLATGARVNAATLSNGTAGDGRTTTNVLLSRDGKTAAFGNNSTNLLGGLSPLGGAELRAYRKLLP
jgi:Tol biopolymer transport system component